MTLRDHERLQSIMAYKPQAAKPAILMNATEGVHHLRRLKDDETVSEGDIIEDMASGDRAVVSNTGFYGAVAGYKARQVKELDRVFDVLRPE